MKKKSIKLIGKMTVSQVAEYTGYSEKYIRNLVYRNEIPYEKVRGRLMFDVKKIEKWLDR